MFWYYRRPLLGYFVLFAVALFWGFTPRSGQALLFDTLVLPWALLALVTLNLPFMRALCRGLRLSESERRNHALEHATIHFLRTDHGYRKSVGGRALPGGFRIWGVDKDHIRQAFNQVIALEPDARFRVAVAKQCGSTIVFAEALGITLLIVCVIVFAVFSLPPWGIAAVLLGQLTIFLLFRYPIGLALQKPRLLSVDFSSARIVQINKAEAKPGLERPPVFIVHTEVSL